MSQILEDDLEEGEIADDVVIVEVVDKKPKKLPRRYDLNEEWVKSKHKRNCKYSALQNKQENCNIPHKNLKFHRKHHKACPKHNEIKYSNYPVKNMHPHKESFDNRFKHKRHKYKYPKIPLTKSAFKNYMSPPRKVSNCDNLNSGSRSPSIEILDSYPKLLSEYKKSRAELKKLRNSNIKDQSNLQPSNEASLSDNNSLRIPSALEASKSNSDDEDEEELRRLALATCLKRQKLIKHSLENKKSCKASSSVLNTASDNYEVVDMEMGNSDIENIETEDKLFVIDTTPSYFCDTKNSMNSFDSNHPTTINYVPNDGFLPNLCLEGSAQNFTADNFCLELNNDLYSNFELISEDSPQLSSQLDDDNEEELLRAQLLANMNSVRQNKINHDKEKLQKDSPTSLEKKTSKCRAKIHVNPNINNELINEINLVTVNQIANSETNFKEEKIVSGKSNSNQNEITHRERTAILGNTISTEEKLFKDERIVSIINDQSETENSSHDRTRSVTAVYSKHDSLDVPSVRKKVDLQVKLNNVPCLNNGLPSKQIALPQERIIISLNNESSSEDSDDDDNDEGKDLNNQTEDSSAVASLEALIANARHESDGKKDSTNNSNSSSDAVSWLSKAQQEEYNSLKKILDAKKQHLLLQTKIINNAENNGLSLLKRKLLIAKKNFEKEKELMTFTMKDLMKKKRAYMLSKLKVHQLKEQLIGADRVRKSNLQLWTKCSSNLQTLKKSVTKREAIINSIQFKINSLFPEFSTNNCSSLSIHTDKKSNISS